MWGIIWEWLSTLALAQIVAFSLAGLFGLLAVALGIWSWFEKRAIQKIPDLLFKLDQLTLDAIDGLPSETSFSLELCDELTTLLNLTDGMNADTKGLRQLIEEQTDILILSVREKIQANQEGGKNVVSKSKAM